MSELRNCPFCGGEPKVGLFLGMYAVLCTGCLGAIIPPHGDRTWTKKEAIEAWNRRASCKDNRICRACKHFITISVCSKCDNHSEFEKQRIRR